jgi:hypothetical protein
VKALKALLVDVLQSVVCCKTGSTHLHLSKISVETVGRHVTPPPRYRATHLVTTTTTTTITTGLLPFILQSAFPSSHAFPGEASREKPRQDGRRSPALRHTVRLHPVSASDLARASTCDRSASMRPRLGGAACCSRSGRSVIV